MRIHFLFPALVFFALIICGYAHAQEVNISAPQKVVSGYSKVEVLGRNDQGVLVRDIIKDDDQISCFYDNMQLHWKKPVPRREKNMVTEEIILYPDSTLFFYSYAEKGITLLNGFKTNSRMETPTQNITCDTLSRSSLSQTPRVNFVTNIDKSCILFWFQDANFENNDLVHLKCLNANMKTLWSAKVKLSSIEHPDPFWVTLDSDANATLISGEYKIRNFNNDFHYTSFLITTIKSGGTVIRHTPFTIKNSLLSIASVKQDAQSGNVLMAGLYSNDPGNKSDGVYFINYDAGKDSILFQRLVDYGNDFITSLSGNSPPKKTDGFYDFQPKEIIVTADGGAIFIAQSESVTSESFTNSTFGTFGGTNGFTVNYYHFDEVAVFSFNANGTLKWKQVLHKKQATEGDGGYYSSIATMIGATQLSFIYNDATNGQTSLSAFAIDASGTQSRKEIFNADRKGLNVAPRHSKQVSANELVLPSYKKNYLQFVKITF